MTKSRGNRKDILFGNNNGTIIQRLIVNRLKSSRQRNLFVIFAVVLTTALFTAFFSAIGGFLDQVYQEEQRMFGTRHAVVKFLSKGQYESLKSSKQLKEVYYTRLVGTTVNQELLKLSTEVRYAQEEAAKSFLCYPATGTMPQKESDLATSTLVLDALGIPHQLGETILLSIDVDGTIYKKEFTLCGFWKGYQLASAQEVWVSLLFADQVAPAAEQVFSESGRYAGLFCADINFSKQWNIEKQLSMLITEVGIENLPASVNPAYQIFSFAQIDLSFVWAMILLNGIVMFVGYLIIYNLFFISVTQDIQFFGLLRAIGTSGWQIKKIVRKQAFWLAWIGLPFGLTVGYLIGYLLLPLVLTQVSVIDTGVYRISPIFLVGASLFSLLTVYISSLKPCKYAAKISAIEAIRYCDADTGIRKKERKRKRISTWSMAVENLKRNRKKAFFVILSLGLSMQLLNLTYTAVTGFDLDTYLAQTCADDFSVTDYSIQTTAMYQKNLSGISKEFLERIYQLPGLESSSNLYAQEIYQKLPDEIGDRVMREYPQQYKNELSEDYVCGALVYGVEDTIFSRITLMEGTLDSDLWKTGKGVVVSDFYYSGDWGVEGVSPLYQIGDELCLKDAEGKEHSFFVIGIGTLDYRLNTKYYLDLGLMILLPDTYFLELYGEKQPFRTIFNVQDFNIDKAEDWLMDYCEKEEKNLVYSSKRIYEQEFRQGQIAYSVIGGVLSAILALIGILNFANMVAASIAARKKELAILYAVGMSERQIKQMLVCEGFIYVVLAFLWAGVIGTGINYFICKRLITNMWAFQYHFSILPILLLLPFLFGIAGEISLKFYRHFSYKSVIERLQE